MTVLTCTSATRNELQPALVVSDPAPATVSEGVPVPAATILLVEDEECVRNVTREVLESDGYRVLEAEDAIDGIRLCELHRGSVDLVLTDVVMPGMNGREMAKRLVDRHPQVKVVFMSGYTDNPVLRNAFADYNTVYLQKPFTVQVLRSKVREVLQSRTAPDISPA